MSEKGQALIILIVAAAVTLSILGAAIFASISQAKSSARNTLGREVYYAAEAGAEYAILKSIRDPASCAGSEVLTEEQTNITISYNQSGSDCIVNSKAEKGNIVKTIQLKAAYNQSHVFDYSNWLEIP